MSWLWIYANVVLPIVLVAMGAAGVLFLVPWIERQDGQGAGEDRSVSGE